ncbi:MAG TPA: COX15/CtaA family protein [Rhodanobacteraceae bacterium]|nr:COX15/CtaA family protein [Rhodanobacteraceae bacterium]
MSRGKGAAAWLAAAAAVLAFCVIMYGAFVRLSNAGLSCPDWPTCYGKVTWPKLPHDIARADAAFPHRPVEAHKTWREQTHRMAAGTLGALVLALALSAVWRRGWARWSTLAAALSAALAVALYMSGERIVSSALGGLAIALPLAVAWRLPRAPPWRWAVVALALVIFQAALGMWTVTLLLKPIVVMGHLLGGMALFAVLAYIALRLHGLGATDDSLRGLRRAAGVGVLLLACQIALGGWTSSNYAALACGYGASAFPQCLGQWWPPMDFGQGFVLWRGIAVDFQGGILDLPARTAIQMVHRIGALVVFVYLAALVWHAARRRLPGYAAAIGVALVAQVLLGISNVHFALPLPVATAHNGMAALLLCSLLVLLARTQPRPDAQSRLAEPATLGGQPAV